jgi:signal transduction histidine kinase
MDGSGVTAEINALIVGMIGMFFLTLIIILFVVIYQRKLLRQQREHKQSKETHQLELLQATLDSQEKERDRIGRELHDGVGVLLSTARMYLQHWEEEGKTGKKTVGKRIDEMLIETIESVRRVSSDLRPVVLETLGLAEAISDLTRAIDNSSSIDIEFKDSYAYRLAQKDELHIYRVVQELLTNGLRHSEATKIHLEMSSHLHLFSLSYQDNGKGMSKNLIEKKGLGLKNMESRINALKGKWAIKNSPDGGVLINIQIENNGHN